MIKSNTRFQAPLHVASLYQLAVALVTLWLTRLAFIVCNSDMAGDPSLGRVAAISLGGLRFDLAACAWFNVVFIAMRFFPLPLRFRYSRGWIVASDAVYAICNTAMVVLNVADIPYFRFTGVRMSWTSFLNVWKDPDMAGIIASYFGEFWWAFILGFAVIALMLWLAFRVRIVSSVREAAMSRRWGAVLGIASFMVAGSVTFFCIRSNLGAGRPIGVADAAWYAERPQEIAAVLNTPFCMIRTMGHDNSLEPFEFYTPEELSGMRASLHPGSGADSLFTRRNVMFVIMESGASLWLPTLNVSDSERPEGMMPFLDSIAKRSLVVPHAFGTGLVTYEGLTSIVGGFPAFGGFNFMNSPYLGDDVDTPASLLKREGYSTSFYVGCNPGSFNIDHLARRLGFDRVLTRREYGDDSDFDGHWGIFDHAMGEFAVRDISEQKRPFVAGWLTLNPHGPFSVPDNWRPDGYANAPGMRRSVEYVDRALRRFFELASATDWYANTTFIITGDHGCRDLKSTRYDTEWLKPHIMMMVYTPDGSVAPRSLDTVQMSQFDIAPTLMGLLRYPRPYVALGRDVLSSAGISANYAVNFIDGEYQVMSPRYMVRLGRRGEKVTAVFDITTDQTASRPLAAYDREEVGRMARWARALLQDWTSRMRSGRMSASPSRADKRER